MSVVDRARFYQEVCNRARSHPLREFLRTGFGIVAALEMMVCLSCLWALAGARILFDTPLGATHGAMGWLRYLLAVGILYFMFSHAHGLYYKRRWAYGVVCLVCAVVLTGTVFAAYLLVTTKEWYSAAFAIYMAYTSWALLKHSWKLADPFRPRQAP